MEIWHALTGHIDAKEVQESIKSINDDLYSKPVKYVRFLLASGGGDIAASINLYAYLKAMPVEVETIAFGEMDVAASVIFLGGKKRTTVEGCQFFFREGRYTLADATAPVDMHEEAIAVFRRIHQEMVYIIARETGNDTELVANMLRRRKVMLSDEALEFGLSNATVRTLPLHQQEKFGFRIDEEAYRQKMVDKRQKAQ